MEDTTDADYTCVKIYDQRDTVLLADVFEIYEFVPAKFLSAPGLAWQAALKETKLRLDLLTDIDILLMVEKGIRGGIFYSIHRSAKANNQYVKDYKNKELS